MNRDTSRNGLRLPLVAPLAIVEPATPEVIPGAADRPLLPVPHGQRNVDAVGFLIKLGDHAAWRGRL